MDHSSRRADFHNAKELIKGLFKRPFPAGVDSKGRLVLHTAGLALDLSWYICCNPSFPPPQASLYCINELLKSPKAIISVISYCTYRRNNNNFRLDEQTLAAVERCSQSFCSVEIELDVCDSRLIYRRHN